MVLDNLGKSVHLTGMDVPPAKVHTREIPVDNRSATLQEFVRSAAYRRRSLKVRRWIRAKADST
jgi:hypothetical protein